MAHHKYSLLRRLVLICVAMMASNFIVASSYGADLYQRNVARPVNQVVFASVDSARNITKQQVLQSTRHGWHTLSGALIGGLLGYQFGDGTGQIVATTAGAVLGAGIADYRSQTPIVLEYQLVELLLKTEQGELINVIQDKDPNMRFKRGDAVRILYFDEGVRVDLAY
ncbi:MULTISPECIES: glycine zipper 2TM domain-containing protein [unclassified Motilimonas]|uniref:glycine zipper 2TM domain-containing protein n=1 Tax=Motilimonas TaxID=1914248 RepID=UPI001E2D20B3|nr:MULTISPECIES: glycine zipper 2TM domain-containing protein [unclassified Motilimonas]MCE0556418.1 glycine zipper 2TM domain-containing protein [Motilimonas sp. E26]MDO6525812.1 glycine zipper 2TM domain-containing protein [Motilimonas sp. 1_MG-2023]